MATGVVKDFNPAKGWGFIRPDDGGPDVMVHVREMAPGEDPARLKQGARVSYDERSAPRGLRAANVRVLAPPAEEPPAGFADVLTAAELRDELSLILAEAVSRMENAARRHGWIELPAKAACRYHVHGRYREDCWT